MPLTPPQPRPAAFGHRQGFTLIELLAVIAIIGILAAIMVPTLSKVKESAGKSSCASNLHQIAVSTLAYASDHKGALPPRTFTAYPHSMNIADWMAFSPYLGNGATKSDVMYCPGAIQEWRGPAYPQYEPNDTATNGATLYITYSFFGNIPLSAQVQTAFQLSGQSVLKNINTVPANLTLWSCLTCYKPGDPSPYYGHSDCGSKQMVQSQNAAQADGSVRAVKGSDLIPYFVSNLTIYGPGH